MNETAQNSSISKFFFWEDKLIKDTPLWNCNFDNKPLTHKSKFVYTGIIDNSKNIFECGWASYPDIFTLLGFVQHVFLPTSLLTWFDNSIDTGFFIPLSHFDVLIDEIQNNSTKLDYKKFFHMEKNFHLLNQYWAFDSNSLFIELDNFCNQFSETWDSKDKKVFIKIFNNPNEIFNFIKKSLEWDFEDFIEQEINMSLDKLKFTCQNAIIAPLLNKKFIDILNINMPIMF